jgi:hypothetical protein
MGSERVLWLVVFALVSLLVGCISAWLRWLGKRNVPLSISAGGVAFAGTIALSMAIYAFVASGH